MENRSKKKAGSPRRQPSKRARLVRRAEKYMRANLGKPLSMFDLCRKLCVSERTLHYAFQELRGLSPMAYFKACRLNAVRQELKAASTGTTTVREIAQRWGFWHTGEFAADYRRLFGELPSQTLNGQPGSKPPKIVAVFNVNSRID
jgi:AraC family ethanolamine operon transcriptional activator